MLTDWTKDYMTENNTLIEWPMRFKPLPEGYTVWWVDAVEHYMGIGPLGAESSIYSSRFYARRWCFAHHHQQQVCRRVDGNSEHLKRSADTQCGVIK